MPELQDDVDGRPNDAAVIAVLCVVAADVWDVREIIRLMMRSNDPDSCTSSEIEEILHFMAFAFTAMERDRQLPLKFHFNVAHALYFFENDWSYIPLRSARNPLAEDIRRREVCQERRDICLTADQLRCTTHPLRTTSVDHSCSVN